MKYWTDVYQYGDNLLVRGIENGQKYTDRVPFYPTIWIEGAVNSKAEPWTTIDGQTVYTFQPGTIKETRAYVEQCQDVQGKIALTTPGNVYQYIADNFDKNIRWNIKEIDIVALDIETKTEYGFPDPKEANEEIQLITVKNLYKDRITTFGTKPYNPKDPNVKYVYCSSEVSLLREFINWWQSNYPDIITGWNTALFDQTYLYNRICRVIDEKMAKKLSPWSIVQQREVSFGSTTSVNTKFIGIASLDYLDLYKKFTYSKQESYKLDYIANVELGENKLVNPESTFKDFYTKHWDTFVEYNIHDVVLIDKLDAKMKLIDLALTMAYDARVNITDVFSPVKTWDVIIFNYLYNNKVVVPPLNVKHKEKTYEGAYVKDPIKGKHNWVCSFDYTSLYPMIIEMYNMSPETITNTHISTSVDGLLNKIVDTQLAHDLNYSMAANGWCFKKDTKGILPTLIHRYFNERAIAKKKMLRSKQELETIIKELERRELI